MRRRVFLIRKTGEGKSAVLLASATIKRGLTLVLVPLLVLGCDQVAKGFKREHRVKTYHLDEHRGHDFIALRDRLLRLKHKRSQSIILFASPQSLQKNSLWHPVFQKLSSRNLFTLFVLDEAHCVERNGRSFRPEFYTGIKDFSPCSTRYETYPFSPC